MRRLFAAGLLLVVVLLLSKQAGATKPQPHTTRARAAVWTLALGGPRVAYASAGRIYVWNVVTGRTSVIGGGYSNAAHACQRR